VDRTWTRGAASPVLVGIRRERADLWHRIEDRVRAMYEGGLVEEVRGLLGGRQALGRTARQAIGYAEAAACLEGRCSLAEAMDRTVCRTRRLAKRQMTWFRHQANVRWITAAATVGAAEVAREVLAAWEELGPVPVR
jgi:tRNA dimethylallyltransferase